MSCKKLMIHGYFERKKKRKKTCGQVGRAENSKNKYWISTLNKCRTFKEINQYIMKKRLGIGREKKASSFVMICIEP